VGEVMACTNCHKAALIKKFGRCMVCMVQCAAWSLISWGVWYFFYRENPKSVESIGLIGSGIFFSGLLFLHLWAKIFIVKREGY